MSPPPILFYWMSSYQLYAVCLTPAFHSLKDLTSSLTASSTSVFNYHLCFLHGYFAYFFCSMQKVVLREDKCSFTVLFCCSSMSYISGSKILQEMELCLFLLTLQLLQFDVWHKLALELVGIETLKSPTITLCNGKS